MPNRVRQDSFVLTIGTLPGQLLAGFIRFDRSVTALVAKTLLHPDI